MHDTITVGGGQVRPENAGLSRRHSVMRLIESWPPAQAGSGAAEFVLVACRAFGPDDGDGHSSFVGGVHDVGGASVAAGGLSVPDSKEVVRFIQHAQRGLHVCLAG